MKIRAELVFEGSRKALVTDIANAFGMKAQYQGAPTFAYKVAFFTITRDNHIEWTDEDMLADGGAHVLGELVEAGRFAYGRFWVDGKELPSSTAPEETPAETAPVGPTSEETEPAGITAQVSAETGYLAVYVPDDLTNEQYTNLYNLVEQKQNLLRQAFPGITDEVFRFDMGCLEFHWFAEDDKANAEAYKLFVARMVDMAKAAKRVSTKQNPVTNPKYQFRCFLLRLGFIGKEYGPARKALMKNLSGNSAWLRGSKDA